jgi:hypothetical protein
MRSSPKFLVASRSGGDVPDTSQDSSPEGLETPRVSGHLERPRGGDGAEIAVRVAVGYKTVLLVVVIFDLVHLSLREILNTNLVEHLLLGIGS